MRTEEEIREVLRMVELSYNASVGKKLPEGHPIAYTSMDMLNFVLNKPSRFEKIMLEFLKTKYPPQVNNN